MYNLRFCIYAISCLKFLHQGLEIDTFDIRQHASLIKGSLSWSCNYANEPIESETEGTLACKYDVTQRFIHIDFYLVDKNLGTWLDGTI